MEFKYKVVNIQNELKAPKGQYNSFGKYKYRSCEDILEGVKPLLAKYECTLTVSDEVFLIGERYYVKATACLRDCASGETFECYGYAREEEDKKGMDASQVTGACSSYARKYALNGLFLIDDTKDADTDEYTQTTKKEYATESQQNILKSKYNDNKDVITQALADAKVKKLSELTVHQASELIKKIGG